MTKLKSYDVDNTTIADALGLDSIAYAVPQFQRKYAWTKKEVNDLLFDLFEEIDWSKEELAGLTPHFLGSIVTANENGIGMILDGQQRLTSVSLLLAVIKRKLTLENSEKAGTIDPYLMRVSRRLREENQIKIQLQPEDAEIYRTLLKDPTKWGNQNLANSLVAKATRAIVEKVDEYLRKAEEFSVSTEAALLSMLERTLDYTMVVKIVAPSEADAFRLFETLNDRGLALNAADLVKNKLLARCKEQKNIDEAVGIWGNIIELVGEDEVVDFLRYYWIAFHGNVRQRELYKVFENHLRTVSPSKALDLVRDLRDSARAYNQIANPSDNKPIWKQGVNEVLRRLVIYKARSCRPILLACAKHRPEDMLKVVRACEVLTVRYSIVSNLSSSELDRSYAQAARELKSTSKRNVLEILETHLTRYALSNEEFERNFTGVCVTSVSETWRQILIQLNEALSTGETDVKDAKNVHVEHVFPQKPSAEALREARLSKEAGESLVCKLGNLTLLSGELNRKASNRPFSMKKASYKVSEITLNKEIADKSRWSEKEINDRGRP